MRCKYLGFSLLYGSLFTKFLFAIRVYHCGLLCSLCVKSVSEEWRPSPVYCKMLLLWWLLYHKIKRMVSSFMIGSHSRYDLHANIIRSSKDVR